MLDIKYIRDNPEKVKKAAKDKNSAVDVDRLLELDEKRRLLQGKIDDLNRERNLLSGQKGKPSAEIIEKGKKLKEEHARTEEELKLIEPELETLLLKVPNMPTEDTPIGRDESHNQVIREWGKKPEFDFTPKPHWELGESLDILDNERAAKVAGARFSYFKKEAALLELALVNYAVSLVTDESVLKNIIAEAKLDAPSTPFEPVIPPMFIRPDAYMKMARLEPKDDRYYIPSDDLYLIGSAEHTLGPMHMDEIIPEHKLPIRYVGFSPALRREAGAAGKDTRGILRLHEFHKVEMESFSVPEEGINEHLLLVAIQEHILRSLGLCHQVILKCTADIGDPNARGVDLNTWMPGQGAFRETHTADYMSDFQARRLGTKARRKDGSSEFVHTSDATCIAIGRTLAAIIENYQTKEGTVLIPEILHPYTFGVREIKR